MSGSRGASTRSLGGGQEKPTSFSMMSTAASRRLVSDYRTSRHALRRRSSDEYVAMGQAYLASGYAEPAIRAFTTALSDSGPRVDALHGRANAHELMGAYGAAVADYTAAIRVQPLTPQLFKSRASALLAMERYEEAMQAFEHTMAICSLDDDPGAKESYGRCLFELSEHGRAEAVLSEVLADDKGRALSFLYRGCARMELRGEHDAEAVADFGAAHALDPALPTQMRHRAQSELRAGNAEQAAQTLSRCVALDRQNPLLLFERARCWLRCQPPDLPRALADMSACAGRLRAAQTGWGDQETLIGCLRGRADLLLEMRRPADAVQAFDELVGMYPPAELPRGVVVGRLRAVHALQAQRAFDKDADPEEWSVDEIARATADSDTLCDVHAAPHGDPATVGVLLREMSGTPSCHYLRANLLARATWAKPVGARRDAAMREALGEFWEARRRGFDVRACGPGRPGVVVTTAWSLGASEPELPEDPRPVPSLAKLSAVALAAAGSAASGVGGGSPGFAHTTLCALLARECLPRAVDERTPSAAAGAALVAHVLAQRRADTLTFDWARWAGAVLSGSLLGVAHANGGSVPRPNAGGAAGAAAAKGGAAGQGSAEPHSLRALCVLAIGGTLPKQLAEPFELAVQVRASRGPARSLARPLVPRSRDGGARTPHARGSATAAHPCALPLAPMRSGKQEGKVVRDSDEAMISFRVLWEQLRQPAAEAEASTKRGAARKK